MSTGIHDYSLFLASALALNLTPGQDTFFILGRAIAHGRPAGVAAALGISAGTGVHCFAAALGLSAIIEASDAVFTAMKLAGALYLVYIGLQMICGAGVARANETGDRGSRRTAFRQGLITNVANPKVALFFLALLPQFVDPTAADRMIGLFLLGTTFVATSTAWGLTLAFCAARLGNALSASPTAIRWIGRAAGGLFIVMGARLALSER